MTELREHIRQRLAAEGEHCLQFFRSLQPGDWETGIYTEGASWTTRQVLAHFVVTERALRTLIEQAISGTGGVAQDFDIDRFNETQVGLLDGETPSRLLEYFRDERSLTLQLLEGLEPQQLNGQAHHPYFGMMYISQLLKWAYQHARVHLRDIRRQLPAG